MPLIEALKRMPQARKLFGRREIAIIEKQLAGVKLTQSEMNRLSRDIRKKFETIKALAPLSDEFGLKKGADTKRRIEEAKEIIMQNLLFRKIRKIVLYGSAAENSMSLSSDIDIAVEFSEISSGEAAQFRKSILGKTSERIDVQVYNGLSAKVKGEIDSKGRMLYERATDKR